MGSLSENKSASCGGVSKQSDKSLLCAVLLLLNIFVFFTALTGSHTHNL